MKDWIKTYLGGICMGAADIVPGVSGGTIAFILGFYERLITALSGVNKDSILMLIRGDIKGLWKHFDLGFLLVLGAGIFSSIIFLSSIILYVLNEYALYLWSFFFGLILASSLVLIKSLNKIQLNESIFIGIGMIFGYLLSTLSAIEIDNISHLVFFSGMISICAMLLPGISGSFILLMLGMYEVILNAIKDLNFNVLSLFCLGAFLGLIFFSKLLKYMILSFKDGTISLLIGIMIGSLVKIWPWKGGKVLELTHDEYMPSADILLFPWNVNDYHFLGDVLYPLLCMVSGFLLVSYSGYIFLHKK